MTVIGYNIQLVLTSGIFNTSDNLIHGITKDTHITGLSAVAVNDPSLTVIPKQYPVFTLIQYTISFCRKICSLFISGHSVEVVNYYKMTASPL